MAEKQNLTTNLKKLQEIADWFDNREEVDVEEGLKKVKEGAALIKASKQRLQEIENEFKEIQKDINLDDEAVENDVPSSPNKAVNPKDIPF